MHFISCSVVAAAFAIAGTAARGQHAIERQDVEFRSDSLTLAGTLYLPQREAGAPAVVLIHGSGAADRASLRY